jgi:hypothetical protein
MKITLHEFLALADQLKHHASKLPPNTPLTIVKSKYGPSVHNDHIYLASISTPLTPTNGKSE